MNEIQIIVIIYECVTLIICYILFPKKEVRFKPEKEFPVYQESDYYG
jgi:hypothetical protein